MWFNNEVVRWNTSRESVNIYSYFIFGDIVMFVTCQSVTNIIICQNARLVTDFLMLETLIVFQLYPNSTLTLIPPQPLLHPNPNSTLTPIAP